MRDYIKNPFRSRKKPESIDPSSPDFTKTLEDQKSKNNKARSKPPKTGDLAPGSIIDSVSPKPSKKAVKEAEIEEKLTVTDPYKMAAVLDPTPRATARWQRKMVIREIRGRGRMSKNVKLARTERSHLSKSELIKTSIKKLFPLANQIAGKPLSEAMVQMRFSKKKAAQDVLKHLEYARDQAIVKKGMGLGKVQVQAQAQGQAEQQQQQQQEGKEPAQQEERLLVEDKKGKKRIVTDRTAMYVDEAWVGRGTPRYGTDFRARGRVNRLTLPYTSQSLPLTHSIPPPYLSLNNRLIILCPRDKLLTLSLPRHLGRVERRSDAHPARKGSGREEAEEEGLGAVAGSTDYGAETVSAVVIVTYLLTPPCYA